MNDVNSSTQPARFRVGQRVVWSELVVFIPRRIVEKWTGSVVSVEELNFFTVRLDAGGEQLCHESELEPADAHE